MPVSRFGVRVMAKVPSFLPKMDDLGTFIRDTWHKLEKLPGGKALYSRIIGMTAPYTGSINATILELGHLHCKTQLKDRRMVRNHLSSVHAIALANLAELTGNMALAYSMPENARFIVAGLSIDYLKKARGTITGTTQCPAIESNERKEYAVLVELRDESGDLVATSTLKTLVGPAKG